MFNAVKIFPNANITHLNKPQIKPVYLKDIPYDTFCRSNVTFKGGLINSLQIQKECEKLCSDFYNSGINCTLDDVLYVVKKTGILPPFSAKNFTLNFVLSRLNDEGIIPDNNICYIDSQDCVKNLQSMNLSIGQTRHIENIAYHIHQGQLSVGAFSKAARYFNQLSVSSMMYIDRNNLGENEIGDIINNKGGFFRYRVENLNDSENRLASMLHFWKPKDEPEKILDYVESFREDKDGQEKLESEIKSFDGPNEIIRMPLFGTLLQNGTIGKEDILSLSVLDENDFEDYQRLLELKGFQSAYSKNKITDITLLRLYLQENPNAYGMQAGSLIMSGIDPFDALSIAFDAEVKSLYFDYMAQGIRRDIVAIMANMKNISDFDINDVSKIIEAIGTSKKGKRVSTFLNNYLSNNNVGDFSRYISSIDFEKLYELAPNIKSYNPEQILMFFDCHFNSKRMDFTPESLSIGEDLTRYVKQNYLTAQKLDYLLSTHPLIKREIGEIPCDWGADEKGKEKIYEAIREFQKTNSSKYTYKNPKGIRLLQARLSQILNKKVSINVINSGSFGAAYKISAEGAMDRCLKIYFEDEEVKEDIKHDFELHGGKIEPQTAFFINSQDESHFYVKPDFGLIAAQNESGFLVTQYLGNGITPEINNNAQNDGYCFEYTDDSNSNKINGVFIDYGGIEVYDKNRIKIS